MLYRKQEAAPSFFLSYFLQDVPSVVSEAPHGCVEFSMYNDLDVYVNYVHFEGGCWQPLLPLFQ